MVFQSLGLPILLLYSYLSEIAFKSSIKSSLNVSKESVSPKLMKAIFFFAINTITTSLYVYIYICYLQEELESQIYDFSDLMNNSSNY